MSAGWQGRPPAWGESGPDTGERLRAALAARSAQVGADDPARARTGEPYDRTGYTRPGDDAGGSSAGPAADGAHRCCPGGRRSRWRSGSSCPPCSASSWGSTPR